MSRDTLTRAQAVDVVADCATNGLQALLDLQQHWIGHRDYVAEPTEAETIAELSGILCEYVDEHAWQGDDTRSNGPKDSDDTGLTAPEVLS
jgi:hypothetical protein